MKYSDLLKSVNEDDLQTIIDHLATFWAQIPKVERPSVSHLSGFVDDVLSFRRRLDKLPDEEKAALMRSVKHIVKEVAGVDPNKIIEESHVEHHGTHFEDGMYWIFEGGGYIPCDGMSHEDFVIDNQQMFIERLGIDGWKALRARHTGKGELMRLVLSSGAVAVQIYGGDRRRAKYQCCQCSLPWVKNKISKMPIFSSIIRVYDPSKEYSGFNDGIKFMLHR